MVYGDRKEETDRIKRHIDDCNTEIEWYQEQAHHYDGVNNDGDDDYFGFVLDMIDFWENIRSELEKKLDTFKGLDPSAD